MLTAALIVLTTASAVLTVAFLGSLRTLAALQLRIQGYGHEPSAAMRLEFGRRLPEPFIETFGALRGYGALAFLAPDCEQCWTLVRDLESLDAHPLVVCVAGHGEAREDFLSRIDGRATVASSTLTEQIWEEMRINATPVVVFHNDGYIVASATGTGARTVEDINRLWREVAQNESAK